MKIEIRSDCVAISGYVNVPGRLSRPVNTPRGRVIETIAQGAFKNAISRAKNIQLMLDHKRPIADTATGNLKVKEDEIGLYADAIITDSETVAGARAGKLRGWSFGMKNVKDNVETRAEGELPVRTVTEFELSEITLSLNSRPFYSATSLEVRADEDEEEIEYRASSDREIETINKTTMQERKDILKKLKERNHES